MSAPVVVVGSLNLDVVVEVPRLPRPGDTVVGSRPAATGPGGKGANQAAAAATFLGTAGSVAMVGCLGDDSAGSALLADLADRGVDVSAVRRTPGPSGTATVALDPHGENLIVVDPGANARLRPQDVRISSVAAADVVLLQLEVPADAVRAAAAHARGRVVLNPAPASGAAASFADVDVLVPNLTELAVVAGSAPAADVDELREQVARSGFRGDVVVTMGARGAVVLTRDGRVERVDAPAVDAIDTTGAGDCFCGVLASLLAEGTGLVDAAAVAVLAASMSVGGRGARGLLPTRDDVAARRTA